MFQEKLQSAKRIIDSVQCCDDYDRVIKSLPADMLLSYYRQHDDKSAMVFLLLPRIRMQSQSFIGCLLRYLLIDEKRRPLVYAQINATVSDDYNNTILHELLVNEAWVTVRHLIDSCRVMHIDLTCVVKKDSFGRTPLDLATCMDVVPVDLMHDLFDLTVRQLLVDRPECIDQSPSAEAAYLIQAHDALLLNLMIKMYRNKRFDLLDWIKSQHPDLHRLLFEKIADEQLSFFSNTDYVQQLHDVCVYAHRSTSALGNALRLPLYNNGGDMIDEYAFYRDSDGLCCVSYVRADTFTIAISDADSFPFILLDSVLTPWDPSITDSGPKPLCFTKSNIVLLWQLIMFYLPRVADSRVIQLAEVVNAFARTWSTESYRAFIQNMNFSQVDGQSSTETLLDVFKKRDGVSSCHGLFVANDHTTAAKITDVHDDTDLVCLRLGDRVEINGLKSHDYNGQQGELIGLGLANGRVRVRLDGGKCIQPTADKCQKIVCSIVSDHALL